MNQLPPQNEVTGRNFTRLDQHHPLKYRLRNPAYIFSPVENIRGQPSPPTGCARSPVSSPEIPSLFFFFSSSSRCTCTCATWRGPSQLPHARLLRLSSPFPPSPFFVASQRRKDDSRSRAREREFFWVKKEGDRVNKGWWKDTTSAHEEVSRVSRFLCLFLRLHGGGEREGRRGRRTLDIPSVYRVCRL